MAAYTNPHKLRPFWVCIISSSPSRGGGYADLALLQRLVEVGEGVYG